MTAGKALPRAFHHAVMPVPSLEGARADLAALGFLVAPDAPHPFGTENACVFFADGTYLEPLAVAQRETCEAEARDGNVFVARDQTFRFRRGVPGFSAIAFGSGDAGADHDMFRRAGLSDGAPLEFSRPVVAPGGEAALLAFKLAFAADRRSPDLSLFTCEVVGGPTPDRSALTRHPNGAVGISRLVLSEQNPTDFQYLLQDLAGRRDVGADSFGMSIDVGTAFIEALTPTGLAARYGRSRDETRGLIFEGVVVSVADLGVCEAFLAAGHLPVQAVGGRLVVALSRDAFIAFEQG